MINNKLIFMSIMLLNSTSLFSAANSNEESFCNDESLRTASREGNLGLVEKCINLGINVNAGESISGITALSNAAVYGHSGIIKLLIDAGANIDAVNILGSTALMAAAKNGHTQVVTQLLFAGADIDIKSQSDKKALDIASENRLHDSETTKKNKAEIAKMLQNEQQRRDTAIKNRQDSIQRVIGQYLSEVLTQIVAEYNTERYIDLPLSERK